MNDNDNDNNNENENENVIDIMYCIGWGDQHKTINRDDSRCYDQRNDGF